MRKVKKEPSTILKNVMFYNKDTTTKHVDRAHAIIVEATNYMEVTSQYFLWYRYITYIYVEKKLRENKDSPKYNIGLHSYVWKMAYDKRFIPTSINPITKEGQVKISGQTLNELTLNLAVFADTINEEAKDLYRELLILAIKYNMRKEGQTTLVDRYELALAAIHGDNPPGTIWRDVTFLSKTPKQEARDDKADWLRWYNALDKGNGRKPYLNGGEPYYEARYKSSDIVGKEMNIGASRDEIFRRKSLLEVYKDERRASLYATEKKADSIRQSSGGGGGGTATFGYKDYIDIGVGVLAIGVMFLTILSLGNSYFGKDTIVSD